MLCNLLMVLKNLQIVFAFSLSHHQLPFPHLSLIVRLIKEIYIQVDQKEPDLLGYAANVPVAECERLAWLINLRHEILNPVVLLPPWHHNFLRSILSYRLTQMKMKVKQNCLLKEYYYWSAFIRWIS